MELSLVSTILANKNENNSQPVKWPVYQSAAKKQVLLSPDTMNISIKNNQAFNFISFSNNNEEIKGVAKGTGYYPDSSKMQGGYHDKKGENLYTLQDYLEGKAPYVSIALDKNLYKSGAVKYGDKYTIPELEAKYNRKIEFRAVDTGGAFTDKGFSRVDICARSKKDAWDNSLNGKLTLIKV